MGPTGKGIMFFTMAEKMPENLVSRYNFGYPIPNLMLFIQVTQFRTDRWHSEGSSINKCLHYFLFPLSKLMSTFC